MNFWTLLQRSLTFYRKTHLWVILGTMISTAILVGALVIGDSVRFSLRQIVLDRLGKTEFALNSGDRLFRTQMADDISKMLGTSVTPLLQTRGIAIAEGGQRRLNNIQIIGVDARFGEIGNAKDLHDGLSPDEAIVNRQLASRLQLKKGDELLVRIEKLDIMPKDAPLALDMDSTIAQRFKIKAIASDSEFGRFNLNADQVAPSTVFVSLSSLSQEMGFDNRANVLLVSERTESPLSLQAVKEAFKDTWTLADAGLQMMMLPGRNMIELKSDRVFLDPPVENAALDMDKNAQTVLTYFVNEIRRGDKATPYSFVSAPGTPVVPSNMKDDEIIINEWLAGDLDANEGDQIKFTYYVLGLKRDLIEVSSDFRIKAIVPLSGAYLDKELMPNFPGLANTENCRDWNPGIPIDLNRIRDEDENYWDNYRGTPKAFVTLNASQQMWKNRFGNLTAIRFSGLEKKKIENNLTREIDPAQLGFIFREVKKEGLRASKQSVSFAGLFLGLSFFIILAALLLTGLLFVFNVETRSEEIGLFLALGFSRKGVMRLVLFEGAVLVIIGSLLGSVVGVFYNQVILFALKTVWHGAVGTSALQVHLKVVTLLTGTGIGILVAFFTIWLVAQKQVKQPITGLQRGLSKLEVFWKKKPRISLWISIVCVVAVILILILVDFERGKEAFAFFFSAGLLLLVSGMAFTNALLFKLGKKTNSVKLSLFNIGVRNNARRRLRSITLIGLLACGLFIVFTVGANRDNSLKNTERRDSGTGGFSLYGESSIPIYYDLNSKKGEQFYGLNGMSTKGVSYVQFRVKEGDDASCLNLNRVSHPQLIGVDPDELTKRASFTFVKLTDEVDPNNPWSVLKQNLSDGTIPAFADQTVIVWGLGKAVGDTLVYTDESGETFDLKLVGGLANSIFQGNIVISEKAFIQRYPSLSGYRLFLIDAPFENIDEVSRDISWAMQDQGLDLVPASTRLSEFNEVQNTYLSIFLILGTFGLILGSIGIGIVVWRNVKERQGELALLRAVGFNRKSIQALVLSEHFVLLISGIFYGIAAALLATLPSLLTPGSEIPYFFIIVLLIAVFVNGGIWTFLATFLATRKDLLPALRNE
ncbi:MAG: FtsX-like permease family protein [Candidatus Aminicenantes bacterium]|nr:FtsX-like permease family protein [Candidatus Aminicenantes bacterium]